MIYDCFTFFNELDLLEIRLNILNEVVDKFVLVEATRTHRGNPKPLYFAENKQRFAPFLDKIIHIVVDSYEPVEKYIASKDSDPMLHSWAYENFQRHSIIRGLNDLTDEDTLIISDLDEIPTAEAVQRAAKASSDGKVRLIQLDHRSYFLNFRNFSNPKWWLGPMVLSGKTFQEIATYKKVRATDGSIRAVLTLPSPQLIRAINPDLTIPHGGWHFSFLGGIEAIIHKLSAFSHSEYSKGKYTDSKYITETLANGGDLFGIGDRYYGSPPEKCLPAFILKNQGKYLNLIFQTSPDYLKRTRIHKAKASIFHVIRTITPHWVKQIYFFLNSCRTRR